MHIPDGFLDAKTAAVTGALAATGLAVALRHVRKNLPPRRVPLLGLSAAFVFAAQMLNFPVAGGTSGHLIGAVLTAALLGASAAVVVISAVLIVQCFMFADGGITALGANILNMALIGGVGGWAVYDLLSRAIKGLFGRIVAASFGAWCSTVLASIACAGELSASGTTPLSLALPAMAGVHMLIGIGEGIITAMVLAAVLATRPELLAEATDRRSYGPLIVQGGLIALALALLVSPFASTWPDGLDKTAEDLGFAVKASAITPAPMPEYEVAAIPVRSLSTAIAGATGTVVVFALGWLLARVLTGKTKGAVAAEVS